MTREKHEEISTHKRRPHIEMRSLLDRIKNVTNGDKH